MSLSHQTPIALRIAPETIPEGEARGHQRPFAATKGSGSPFAFCLFTFAFRSRSRRSTPPPPYLKKMSNRFQRSGSLQDRVGSSPEENS